MKGLEGAQVLCSVYIRGLVMGDSSYLVFGWLIFIWLQGLEHRRGQAQINIVLWGLAPQFHTSLNTWDKLKGPNYGTCKGSWSLGQVTH